MTRRLLQRPSLWLFALRNFSSTVERPGGNFTQIPQPTRLNQEYFKELCDALWYCHRGVATKVDRLMLLDAPRLTMRCKAWSEFVDDGLLSVWIRQMLRKDVIGFMRPASRLAYTMSDAAKILTAAKNERTDATGTLTREDEEKLHVLLDEMVYIVFVQRETGEFKYVSAATEALARFAFLLDTPSTKDKVPSWRNSLHHWIKSGRLSANFLTPILEMNDGDKWDASRIGMTSLASILKSMAVLEYEPSSDILNQLAHCSYRLYRIPNQFMRNKMLIDYVYSWHTWRIDPESFCNGSWSVWFDAYHRIIQQPGQAIRRQMFTLIVTAFLVAKDFDRLRNLKMVLDITEQRLEDVLNSKIVPSVSASALLQTVQTLSIKRNKGVPVMNDKVMHKLKMVAQGQ